jgi:hypothetical protein
MGWFWHRTTNSTRDPHNNGNGQIPVLRWVSRLHDTVIESNLQLAFSHGITPSKWDIREAEFIIGSSTQAFPEAFDFLTLFDLFSCWWHVLYLTSPDTVITHRPQDFACVQDLDDPNADSVGLGVPMNQPYVVSSCEFVWERADRETAPMRQIGALFCFPRSPFGARKSDDGNSYQRIYTYSLDSFRNGPENHLTPSATQFQFLRHMLRPLPVNFFRFIELNKIPDDFSPHLYSALLTSVTSQERRPTGVSGHVLELRLHSSLNREQLGVIRDQFSHLCLRLSFSKFHEDLDADALNEVLRSSQGIRHFDFPVRLLDFQGSLFVQALRLISLTLKVPNNESVSQVVLESICSHKSLQSLHVNISQESILGYSILRQIICSQPPQLQELSVRFRASLGQLRHALDRLTEGAVESGCLVTLHPPCSVSSVSAPPGTTAILPPVT